MNDEYLVDRIDSKKHKMGDREWKDKRRKKATRLKRPNSIALCHCVVIDFLESILNLPSSLFWWHKQKNCFRKNPLNLSVVSVVSPISHWLSSFVSFKSTKSIDQSLISSTILGYFLYFYLLSDLASTSMMLAAINHLTADIRVLIENWNIFARILMMISFSDVRSHQNQWFHHL